jgi:nitrous-oxide reductase
MKIIQLFGISAFASLAFLGSCKPKGTETAVSGDAAEKVYVAPGKYDEIYNL